MRAVIFGYGKYGKYLKRGLEKFYGVEIVAVCDNDKHKQGTGSVVAPEMLLEISFDKIFICLRRVEEFKLVEQQLLEMGISEQKIVIMEMNSEYQDAYIELDPFRKNWIRHFADYTREAGLIGNVAEGGVFQGETAMFINRYWPDKTLYLFDTFEGFAQNDIDCECKDFPTFKNSSFACNPFNKKIPDLLIQTVKSRMRYPDNVKIYKGYFPESAGNINDKFCFVNLDMDLYLPQLEGLRFFWNKMEVGGVILLHDYFHPELPGVKAAVEDFENEVHQTLPKIPIGDNCSIAVIKNCQS